MHTDSAVKASGKTRKKRLWLVLPAAIAVVCAVFLIYVGQYYHAEEIAVETMYSSEAIEAVSLSDGVTAFVPEQPEVGLIFYPGGKVDEAAYAPLMRACAEQGVLCVLVKMPFHLAVLDQNAADGIAEEFPAITSWYIAGHSLGGAMAASYASKHTDTLAGVILLAAYSMADLSEAPLRVLSIYGTDDGVMDREKYAQCAANLPKDTQEIVIDGANHAGFGRYGAQKGDGIATITAEAQISATVRAIREFLLAAE